MVAELSDRKNKLNMQLDKLDNQPKFQAEKKGQISENLRISENEKNENEQIINTTDEKIDTLRNQHPAYSNNLKYYYGKREG